MWALWTPLRSKYNDPGDQLREVLRTWLTTSDNPTWQAMVQALKSPVIEEPRLARELQQKYYPSGQRPVEPLTTGSMGTAAVQSMPDGIREYMNEFYFNFQEY